MTDNDHRQTGHWASITQKPTSKPANEGPLQCQNEGDEVAGYLIPFILALQGAFVRGLACWLLRYRGPVAGLSMVVVGQWLRTLPPFAIPISVGHDLVAWASLAQPAALGGGALLVWVCALSSYAIVDRFARPRALFALMLIYGLSAIYTSWVPLRYRSGTQDV